MSQFVAVNYLENYWLNRYNLSSVGGIIGIGFNASNPNSNPFWKNSTANFPQYSLNFGPGPNDWTWINNAPNYTNETKNYLYVGGIDPFLQENLLKSDTK